MFLSRLYISGFRSIHELDLQFQQGKNVIIGRNNSGKSNIIRALDVVLGETAPAYAKSENITESDFHYARWTDEHGEVRERKTETIQIWCELERGENEELNWVEIDKCFGYNFWGEKNTKTANRLPLQNLSDEFREIFKLSEDEAMYSKVWVDSKLNNQSTFKAILDPMNHFAYAFQAELTEKGIQKQIRFLYRESADKDWVLAFKASVRTEILQSAILPAFRDPVTQLRVSPWTWFGKMMRHLTKDFKDNNELQDALGQVQEVGDRIFEGLTAKLENDALSVSFPDAKLSFRFHSTADGDLYRNCSIYINDGYESPITDKGAGIQSATIIGLFSYYTREVNTLASALLCVEEPELYLHPHARRVVSDRLDEFLDGKRNQVIVTTHGVEFLRTSSETFNMLLVSKSREGGTTASALDARKFLRLLIDNNQNELFFADKVILTEGHDEYLVRAIATRIFPGELDRKNVSVISVGGKDQIVSLAKIIVSIGLKCFVLTDFDFLLRDPNKPVDIECKAHDSVEQLCDQFFNQAHLCREGINRSLITKVRNKLREDARQHFYKAKHADEFGNEKIKPFLARLRRAGIGILDGEIEDLALDSSWIAPRNEKLNLVRAYELRKKLSDGEKIENLVDCSSIQEFLEAVFNA